eukprot:CAMPEP_0177634274 /NCGR_PEP_ID=MMETSP0447-20121125/3281_1 /TAXON_ID=0 /ORGANISM="Stygamoeba regulata, Strain BSH-02190019" /LENGTH=1075 /DNA_ID=CAMNT_0019135985 /DNA_START=89 /DNA_END=3316 /DNA_ORIENTATION=+
MEYLSTLSLVHAKFMVPCAERGVLSVSECRNIFSVLPGLIQTHQDILKTLVEGCADEEMWRLYERHLPNLQGWCEFYAANLPAQAALLEECMSGNPSFLAIIANAYQSAASAPTISLQECLRAPMNYLYKLADRLSGMRTPYPGVVKAFNQMALKIATIEKSVNDCTRLGRLEDMICYRPMGLEVETHLMSFCAVGSNLLAHNRSIVYEKVVKKVEYLQEGEDTAHTRPICLVLLLGGDSPFLMGSPNDPVPKHDPTLLICYRLPTPDTKLMALRETIADISDVISKEAIGDKIETAVLKRMITGFNDGSSRNPSFAKRNARMRIGNYIPVCYVPLNFVEMRPPAVSVDTPALELLVDGVHSVSINFMGVQDMAQFMESFQNLNKGTWYNPLPQTHSLNAKQEAYLSSLDTEGPPETHPVVSDSELSRCLSLLSFCLCALEQRRVHALLTHDSVFMLAEILRTLRKIKTFLRMLRQLEAVGYLLPSHKNTYQSVQWLADCLQSFATSATDVESLLNEVHTQFLTVMEAFCDCRFYATVRHPLVFLPFNETDPVDSDVYLYYTSFTWNEVQHPQARVMWKKTMHNVMTAAKNTVFGPEWKAAVGSSGSTDTVFWEVLHGNFSLNHSTTIERFANVTALFLGDRPHELPVELKKIMPQPWFLGTSSKTNAVLKLRGCEAGKFVCWLDMSRRFERIRVAYVAGDGAVRTLNLLPARKCSTLTPPLAVVLGQEGRTWAPLATVPPFGIVLDAEDGAPGSMKDLHSVVSPSNPRVSCPADTRVVLKHFPSVIALVDYLFASRIAVETSTLTAGLTDGPRSKETTGEPAEKKPKPSSSKAPGPGAMMETRGIDQKDGQDGVVVGPVKVERGGGGGGGGAGGKASGPVVEGGKVVHKREMDERKNVDLMKPPPELHIPAPGCGPQGGRNAAKYSKPMQINRPKYMDPGPGYVSVDHASTHQQLIQKRKDLQRSLVPGAEDIIKAVGKPSPGRDGAPPLSPSSQTFRVSVRIGGTQKPARLQANFSFDDVLSKAAAKFAIPLDDIQGFQVVGCDDVIECDDDLADVRNIICDGSVLNILLYDV